jgi:hypothetical protein
VLDVSGKSCDSWTPARNNSKLIKGQCHVFNKRTGCTSFHNASPLHGSLKLPCTKYMAYVSLQGPCLCQDTWRSQVSRMVITAFCCHLGRSV